jgi:spermidine synthase
MTDTPFERLSNYDAVQRAQGRVFIGGLGLGMVLLPILVKPTVTHVLVYEQSQVVVDLTLPGLQRALAPDCYAKLEVRLADCKDGPAELPKSQKFDTIYLDIWDDINGDNWPEYKALKRLWRKSLAAEGWLGCWENDNVKGRSR